MEKTFPGDFPRSALHQLAVEQIERDSDLALMAGTGWYIKMAARSIGVLVVAAFLDNSLWIFLPGKVKGFLVALEVGSALIIPVCLGVAGARRFKLHRQKEQLLANLAEGQIDSLYV